MEARRLEYTTIIPRFDKTGPCNVAVDLCRAAQAFGAHVRLLALSEGPGRDDVGGFPEVRTLRARDLLSLRGIVHTHCLRPDLLNGLLSVRKPCFTVTTLHNYFMLDIGFDHARWSTRLSYEAWSRCISRLDARVAISNAMARYYRRLLPGADFDVAYNFRGAGAGRPLSPELADRIRVFVERARAQQRIVLAFVGSLSRRKNVVGLVERVLRSDRLAVILCGRGPLREEIERLRHDRPADERVLLAGHTEAPQEVIARCDMLVLPSFAEGLPLVAVEALSVDRPVLLSNIAVHRELAQLGIGRTFGHKRFRDLEEAASALRRDSERLGPGAYVRLHGLHFSPEVGFGRYRRIFSRHDPAWLAPGETREAEGPPLVIAGAR